MISTLITLPYELARLPLVLADGTLSGTLSETSAPRVALDRTIGSADKLAGAILGNRDIAARGVDRLERSHKVRAAAQQEARATSLRREARDTAASGLREAAKERKTAESRVASGLREADEVEARGKQEAQSRAAKTRATRKAAADNRAQNRTAVVEQRQQRTAAAAEAKKKSAQRKASAELDDARKAKTSAAQKRADAERLEDLTEAKQEQRKQS
ncbi:MAG TPA: hypothetical protein VHO29_04430 [Marmoricola sp.]|nr:hypothetical protein [Marmoricola sp.]